MDRELLMVMRPRGLDNRDRACPRPRPTHPNLPQSSHPQRGNILGHVRGTHPWPPVLGGAPVSPAPMARAVVAKVRDSSAGRASLVIEVRIMVAVGCGVVGLGQWPVRRAVSRLLKLRGGLIKLTGRQVEESGELSSEARRHLPPPFRGPALCRRETAALMA